MARQARKLSSSGIYHVMLRGIGRQILFEDDRDRLRFLEILKKYMPEDPVRLFAYCLMENHVHLLLKKDFGFPDVFMKKVEGSYAYYYNHRYERVGALFQDRYKSESVEDDAYFAVVLRYILQNPEKAGLSPTSNYRWSSYADYALDTGLTDTAFALDMFGGREALLKYVTQPNDDSCLEFSAPLPGESRAKKIIREQIGAESGTVLQSLGKEERDESLKKLKESGLSVRQIERLTGINRGIIQRA